MLLLHRDLQTTPHAAAHVHGRKEGGEKEGGKVRKRRGKRGEKKGGRERRTELGT